MKDVRRIQLIAVLAVVLGAAGLWLALGSETGPSSNVGARTSSAAERTELSPVRLRIVNGRPVLRLSEEEQQYSGIVTHTLTTESYAPERRAYGKVLDIQPLLDLRSEYEAAWSDKEVSEAELMASSKEYERLRTLHDQGEVVAEKQVNDAEALWQADEARLASATTRLESTRDTLIQQWGRPLSAMALDDDSGQLDRFIDHDEVLLLVTLPADEDLPEETQTVYIDRNSNRARARPAVLVSPAPGTDIARQGESWIFRSDGDRLRTGMRLDVWIPQSGEAIRGINLPKDAIVWYAGAPWAYVKIDSENFTRREVPERREREQGWFVLDGFSAGEQVVVSGGQMLLSEEFRWQIPEEDTSDED